MPAYKTEQINVGSIAAPDIGKDLINLGSTLKDNFQTGVANTRNAIADQRAKELFDRQTNEYNRALGVREASKGIARDMLANPYAAKWGGAEDTSKIDAVINQEAQRRLDSGEAPFSEAEAKGIQGVYEQHRAYKEDAKKNIAGQLIAAGATPAEAGAEADQLTSGLISRADEQAYLDAQRKNQQEQYDNKAKANLEILKANIDIGKANQAADEKKAQLVKDYYLGGAGGGASGGSTSGGFESKGGIQSGAGGIDDIVSKIGITDGGYAKQKVNELRKIGYSDNQIFNAMNNAVVDLNSTSIVPWKDKDVRWDSVTAALAKQKVGGFNYNDTNSNIRDVVAGVKPEDLVAQVVPYKRAGYDPDRMLTLLKGSVPSVFHEATPDATGVSSKVIQSNPNPTGNEKVFTLNDGTKVVRDSSIPLTEQLNNPGAIKQADRNNSKIKWQGEIGRDDQGHIIFDTPENGARAQIINMQTQIGKGTTLQDMVKNYATGNQDEYTNRISKETGVKPTDVLTKDNALALVKAMAKVEAGGKATGKYNDSVYDSAYKMIGTGPVSTNSDVFANMSKEDRAAAVLNGGKIANTKDSTKLDAEDIANMKQLLDQPGLSVAQKEDIKAKIAAGDSSVGDTYADKVANTYRQNNGGFWDDNVAITKIMKEKGLGRVNAEAYYDDIKRRVDSVGGPKNYKGDIPYSDTEEYMNANPVPTPTNLIKSAVATGNNIGYNAINSTAGALYNPLYYGYQALAEKTGLPYSDKKSPFDRMANYTHDVAVDQLGNITDSPEAVLTAANIAAPIGVPKAREIVSPVFKKVYDEAKGLVKPTTSTPVQVAGIKTRAEMDAAAQNMADQAAARNAQRNAEELAGVENIIPYAEREKRLGATPEQLARLKDKKEKEVLGLQLNRVADINEAKAKFNGLVEARNKGWISNDQFMQEVTEMSDAKLISPKDIMEATAGKGRSIGEQIDDLVYRNSSDYSIKQIKEINDKLNKVDGRTAEGKQLKAMLDEALAKHNTTFYGR